MWAPMTPPGPRWMQTLMEVVPYLAWGERQRQNNYTSIHLAVIGDERKFLLADGRSFGRLHISAVGRRLV